MCFPAFVAALSITASWAGAQAPVPVTLDASSVVRFRVTLAGRQGQDWVTFPAGASLQVGSSGSTVTIKGLHLAAPAMNCSVNVAANGPTMVSISGFQLDGAPASGFSLAAQDSGAGTLGFSGNALGAGAIGTANYQAVNLSCATIQSHGGVCSGPFNLAAVGAFGNGAISGTMTTTGPTRSCALVFMTTCPLVANATWGWIDVRADLSGTFTPESAASCTPDFDADTHLTTGDIFAFLNAWFAGAAGADFDQSGGLGTPDIFAFLNAWFAGCP